VLLFRRDAIEAILDFIQHAADLLNLNCEIANGDLAVRNIIRCGLLVQLRIIQHVINETVTTKLMCTSIYEQGKDIQLSVALILTCRAVI